MIKTAYVKYFMCVCVCVCVCVCACAGACVHARTMLILLYLTESCMWEIGYKIYEINGYIKQVN